MHLDPDRLVLLALGEEPAAGESEHLERCPACRAAVDADRRVARLGREAASLRDLPPPPAAVWERIAAEALLVDDRQRDRADQPARPAVDPSPAPAVDPAPRPVRRPGPWRRRLALALAAAAGAAVGGLGVAQLRPDQGTPAARVVARAVLTAVPGAPREARGTARVVDTGHGLELEISVSGVPATTGYYQVWLYDGRDVMVPLGSPAGRSLAIPAAAGDLRVFHVVDVSAQALGQQQHGRSVLQGGLER